MTEKKAAPYLAYAIGEIFLVVIGILIALSINNWNEGIKERKQLEGYLAGILKNIQTDTTAIRIINRTYKRANKAGIAFMRELLTESYDPKILVDAMVVFGEQYVTIDQSSFESLKSSGYIGKLQGSQLGEALFRYYNYHQQVVETETSYNNFVEQMEAALFDGNPDDVIDAVKFLGEVNPQLLKFSRPRDEVSKNIYRTPQIVGAMARASIENTAHYDSLLSYATQLLSLLEEELKD